MWFLSNHRSAGQGVKMLAVDSWPTTCKCQIIGQLDGSVYISELDYWPTTGNCQRRARCCWAWGKYLCKPYLHQIFLKFILEIIFFLMLMKECVFVSKSFLLLHKLKKGRRPNLCQLFTCWTLVEPSQMIPAILVDQLQ